MINSYSHRLDIVNDRNAATSIFESKYDRNQDDTEINVGQNRIQKITIKSVLPKKTLPPPPPPPRDVHNPTDGKYTNMNINRSRPLRLIFFVFVF